MAAPIKTCKRDEQEIWIGNGRLLEGLANGHRACARWVARSPEAKCEGRTSATDHRQGGRESFRGERSQKQKGVWLIAQRMEG